MIRPGKKWTSEEEAARLWHWAWIDALNALNWFGTGDSGERP